MTLITFTQISLLLLLIPEQCRNLPFSSKYENALQDNSAINNLLEHFKNLNASNLFESFRLPACVQDCVNELGNTLASLNFEKRWSLEKTRATCRQFEAMKKCLGTKPGCNSMIIEIGMHAFTYICSDDEANTGLIPCIRRETLKIHAICERACKLGATLLDAATLNPKTTNVLNFLDEKGNKIMSVPDLHRLCNSSTCFLSCMRAGIEEKCPNGGSAFVDNMMRSFMKEVTSNHILPETRVVDAYASIVSSFLPRQCQYLVLEEKDIILTTPSAPFVFVTEAHEPIVTTSLQTTEGTTTTVSDSRSSNINNDEVRSEDIEDGRERAEGNSKIVSTASTAAHNNPSVAIASTILMVMMTLCALQINSCS